MEISQQSYNNNSTFLQQSINIFLKIYRQKVEPFVNNVNLLIINFY